jgi:hypothetical protein
VNLATMPGPGDEVTWGEVTDPRDPRYVEDESDVCDYDDPTLDIDDLRCAAKERQCAMSEAMFALSELRRALPCPPTARVAVVLARLHDLLEEECPADIEEGAVRSHQEWLRKVKA